jgi:hypothetical protein
LILPSLDVVDTTRRQGSHTLGKNIPALGLARKITTGLPKQVGEVKSVSRGRRGKKRDVEREEKGRAMSERRGEEKRKKKKKSERFSFTLYV